MHRRDAGQEDNMNTNRKSATAAGAVVIGTTILAFTIFGTAGSVPGVLGGATAAHAEEPPASSPRKILYYRNAMGLPDTSPVPKKDEMGMDYVPVYSDEVLAKPGTFRLTTEKIQRAGVRTEIVKRMPLVNAVRATGTVTADESRQAVLTTKFDGFIEKLFVSTTGEKVRAGQTLMRVWIQSTEILIKEADFIGSLQSNAPQHAESAAAMLRQYGVPPSLIAEMRRTGQPTRTITIVAPISGTVMEKSAVEGMHFTAGDTLFRTADLSSVWVLAQISERDLAGLRPGLAAKVAFRDNPGISFTGKVAFIYPQISADTRTVQVRIAVANPDGLLRVGQYADVAIDATASIGAVVAIPESAVIDDGSRQIAFVALPNGVFEPRILTLGVRAGGYDEVRAGLSEGERIVTSGNFLIDAESNLQTALQTLKQPGTPQ
jgi:membrane fusion protein, copper/silver efflux system